MSDNKHSLGLVKMLVPHKSDLMNALKLGGGAAGAITLTDVLLSRLLVRNGAPMVPVKWSPVAIPVLAWLLSRVALKVRFLGPTVANGMIAGGVGVGMSALLARFAAPSVAASAAAAEMTEDAGGGVQGTAGFGLGRAFAGGTRSLGALRTRRSSALYGVGTPDMRAARMLNGATVAIEDGRMAGATVAIEDNSNYASSFQ